MDLSVTMTVFLRPTKLLTRFIPAVVHVGCLWLEWLLEVGRGYKING